MTKNQSVLSWIEEKKELVQPDRVVWIDGSKEQLETLRAEACKTGELTKLNEEKLPGCYLHRTAINDVARVEHRTFICSEKEEDAGPTNNWMAPAEAYKMLYDIARGSYRGRTMYIIPYSMGPVGSPFAKYGIELTDSIYVVLNMAIMTRVGSNVLEALGDSDDWVRGHHCKCDIAEEKRYNSAAFPSARGKTNLAMLIPPEIYQKKGYKVWCVGDDIAWMRIGEDGRLWAVNPENGFFGVAPGTNMKSNPNALISTQKGTIFTNVVHNLDDNTIWWEGLDKNPPKNALNWKGEKWDCTDGSKGAHPNSRFTAPAVNCPCLSPEFDSSKGVPISAIVFGGRRAKTAPLVYQSRDWNNGVFVGSIMASETTAAATGAVGVVRRDPMAMLPFCGYHMGDYWAHWLDMGEKLGDKAPKIFNVNWFRLDDEGKFIWPGFGDNLRVLEWIINRCEGKADGVETPIGFVPKAEDINLEGLDFSIETLKSILEIDKELWNAEAEGIAEFYKKFGDKVPAELNRQLETLKERLK